MQLMQELLPLVNRIARHAGDQIMQVYERDFSVQDKADKSPLTEADLASHHCIVAALTEATPQWPVLSEESSEDKTAQRHSWKQYWLVDPLDGTKEFINRNGEFTVNIALIDTHEAVMGVVYAPATQTAYFGYRDGGAYLQQGDGAPVPIRVAGPHDGPVRIVGSRSHRGNSLDHFIAQVGRHEMVAMGSSLKICLVADGSADVYPRLGPTCEWDTAAAHAVLSAAGGKLVDLQGAELRYNTRDQLLNPHFIAIGGDRRDWLSLVTE